MKVIISGGGIGGLTAALSLHKIGIDVEVYESVPTIEPLGVGINLLPHATRELFALGLQPELDALAIRTRAMRYFNRRGKLVISVPCGEHAGYHWPQYSVHRGELQMLLLNKFLDRAGADKVITGARLTAFEQTPSQVNATFNDPATGALVTTATGDLLIGADGLHSTVRRQLFPTEGAPVYSGFVVFRGAVEQAPYLEGESMIIVGDTRLKIVAYPISNALQQQNKSHINWLASLAVDADALKKEDWTQRADRKQLIPLYADWEFDWLNVPHLLNNTAEIFEFPLYDRNPLERWTFDRVTLLGDAAHPMIPVSSSGAVHAIIDGRALAHALGTHADPVAGLQAYEADRRPQTTAVVQASRRNGPDEVLEVVRQRAPEDADEFETYVPRAELQAIIDRFKDASGFNIETLNNRPSYEV